MQQPQQMSEESGWAELDLRSLAVMRAFLGLFVVLEVFTDLSNAATFFTDRGVLPRSTVFAGSQIWPSLHLGGGGLATLVVLNLALALCGMALLLGWRTRVATFLCWVGLSSLLARNPYVFDRGELELSLILFWSLFLPLGGCWSLDARAGRVPTTPGRGLPAAALILQFAQIYLFAAFLKLGPFWTIRGDGLAYSLKSPLFATSVAEWLSTLPQGLLVAGNYGVLVGEVMVAFLLLCPINTGLLRQVAVAMLLLFHATVVWLFHLGFFPWIGALLPLGLLPKEFWNRRTDWETRLNDLLGSQRLASQESLSYGSRFAIGVCIGLALLSNLAYRVGPDAFDTPYPIQIAQRYTRLEQHWELFAPKPPYFGRFELQKRDGESYRAILVMPEDPSRPEVSQAFPSHRWRMLVLSSLFEFGEDVRGGLLNEMVERWGQGPGEYRLLFRVQEVDRQGELQPPVEWYLRARRFHR